MLIATVLALSLYGWATYRNKKRMKELRNEY